MAVVAPCWGWAITIGVPELVAAAMSIELETAVATGIPRIASTFSLLMPTASSARLRSRWR